MYRKSQKVSARYLQPFGNDTKNLRRASEAPPPGTHTHHHHYHHHEKALNDFLAPSAHENPFITQRQHRPPRASSKPTERANAQCASGGSRGSCRGWQPLPDGNWRPCAEGAESPIFISVRRVVQSGVCFVSKKFMCAFPPAKAPF